MLFETESESAMNPGILMLAVALALSADPVHAHGGHGGAHADGTTSAPPSSDVKLFGRPGDPKKVSRTVTVDMSDATCLTPGDLSFRLGDTVRFVVKNSGKEEHEMLIGTLRDLKEHAESVETDAAVAHDEPYMTHVAAGQDRGHRLAFHPARHFLLRLLRSRAPRARRDRPHHRFPLSGKHRHHLSRRVGDEVQYGSHR